jgi:hypothetical protein
MPSRDGRVAPTNRGKGRLRRYCSGCAHETEHVAWTVDGRGSIPSIRWPAAEPADGTTICVNCGQWRQPASGLALSRSQCVRGTRIATRGPADSVAHVDTADDWPAETAAENEGMPPRWFPLPVSGQGDGHDRRSVRRRRSRGRNHRVRTVGVVQRSRVTLDEREERRSWIEESERWLRRHGHRPDPTRLTWLGEFYDEQSKEWRQSERDERETDELLRRLRARSASG